MSVTELNGSRLVLHCGANLASWDQVKNVHTPRATDTHVPIPHDFLVETVIEGLDNMGFHVQEQCHALYADGLRYFGLLSLVAKAGSMIGGDTEIGEGRRYVFGLRNGHDKSIVAGGVLGTQVFVCDNLSFHSGGQMFKFARKHTRWCLRDLPEVVATRIAGLRDAMHDITIREQKYEDFNFNDADDQANLRSGTIFNDCMMRLLRIKAITTTSLPHIVHEYERLDGPGGHAHAGDAWRNPTLFRLLQAVTEVEKERPGLLNVSSRHSRMHGIFDAIATNHKFIDVAEIESRD